MRTLKINYSEEHAQALNLTPEQFYAGRYLKL